MWFVRLHLGHVSSTIRPTKGKQQLVPLSYLKLHICPLNENPWDISSCAHLIKMQAVIWTWFWWTGLTVSAAKVCLSSGSTSNWSCRGIKVSLAQRELSLGLICPGAPRGFDWGFARSVWPFVFIFCLILLPSTSQVLVPNKCPIDKIPSQCWLSENPTPISGQLDFPNIQKQTHQLLVFY